MIVCRSLCSRFRYRRDKFCSPFCEWSVVNGEFEFFYSGNPGMFFEPVGSFDVSLSATVYTNIGSFFY